MTLCNSDEDCPLKFVMVVNGKEVAFAITSVGELRKGNAEKQTYDMFAIKEQSKKMCKLSFLKFEYT